MGDNPLVTVIMPVRDEAEHIGAALASVLTQDHPADRMEVLVVDGGSTDGTTEQILELAAEDHRVHLLHNPAGIVPVALNLGLERATGSVVVRVDGHCALPSDYLRRCLLLLDETGADCVGGVILTEGENPTARAIAAAQRSVFGVGNAAFRTGRRGAGPVDTLAFGAYRRSVFDRLGGFREELVRNQDDEFNLRLTESGGTIWLDPSLRSTYRSRATLGALWRQYYQYGSYKVRVAQIHHRLPAARNGVPVAFVLALLGAVGLSVIRRRPAPLMLVVAPYAVATSLATTQAAREDPRLALRLPAAFVILHLAYGTGFLAGLHRWRRGFLRK